LVNGTVPVSASFEGVGAATRTSRTPQSPNSGQRAGIFKRRASMSGALTQGGPGSHQAVISGSMDLAAAAASDRGRGYSRNAPLRIITLTDIGSPTLIGMW
jgi:hypothetical protein